LHPAERNTFYAMGMAGSGLLAGIFLLPGANRRKKSAMLAMVLIAFVAGSTSCGGGGSNGGTSHTDPGTPAGNYSIDVTAKTGVLSHDASFTLTVN
jgi:hypothetical protein